MGTDKDVWRFIAFMLITGAIVVVTVPIGLIAWLLYVVFT